MKILFQSTGFSGFTTSLQKSSAAPVFGRNVDTVELQAKNQVQLSATETKAEQFIQKHAENIKRLSTEAGNAGWNSYCQGAEYIEPGQTKTNEQREAEAEKTYKDYFNNPEAFKELAELLKNKEQISNRLVLRQLTELHKGFEDAGKTPELLKLEKELIDRTNFLVGIFNNYRAQVDGKTLAKMDIIQRLEKGNDAAESKKLWLANSGHGLMKVSPDGPTLAEALVDLVKQRNEVARQNKDKNGKPYTDYYSMQLDKADIKEDMLVQLLDQMDEATKKPFEATKKVLDQFSAKRYGIPLEETSYSWIGSGNLKRLLHFDLQPYLKGKDPLKLLEATANEMGDTLKPIFDKSVYTKNGEKRSAIYFDPEKDNGKSQHWFSFGINPPDDVRTFGSIDPKHETMMDYAVNTLLHECTGHGLDGTHIDKKLPKLLQEHHSITTESHAMLLEDLGRDAKWLEKIVGIPKEEAKALAEKAKKYDQANTLSQIRGFVTIIQFERQMYKNPNQDLGKLWWDLQEKYMGKKHPPEGNLPSHAQVPHFFSHPVYYQNYFLADLARAQKLEYIEKNYGGLLTKETGDYLQKYRKLGNSYDWDDLVKRMTGQPLGVDALKRSFENFKPPTA